MIEFFGSFLLVKNLWIILAQNKWTHKHLMSKICGLFWPKVRTTCY